jgi:hypothetical protein
MLVFCTFVSHQTHGTPPPPLHRGFCGVLFYATCMKCLVHKFVTQICLCQKTDHVVRTILEWEV